MHHPAAPHPSTAPSHGPRRHPARAAIAAAYAAALCAPLLSAAAPNARLDGWAMLPADTFSDGPTSGQFITPNPYGTYASPYVDRQPVQGFSAVLAGPDDSLHMLQDNGFGAKDNSADALLRMVAVRPDWRTAAGGSGTVSAADWTTGAARPGFDVATRITLSDTRRVAIPSLAAVPAVGTLGFPVQADHAHYYDDPRKPAVDPAIRRDRLLTGADLDVESVRQDRNGNLWFGDEFGPFLVKTDASGRVLRRAIPMPGVQSPQNPYLGSRTPNLPRSGGFEGMAINPAGTTLEQPVTGETGRLRIDTFDIAIEAYTGQRFFYPLDPAGTNIGDMTALDDHRFVVIERNGATATSTAAAPFKKMFLIDTAGVANGGTVAKRELIDLMNIDDPHDLNRDGSTTFTFPYTTIEDILPLADGRFVIVNDDNFPYGGGRALAADPTESLLITAVPEPGTWAMLALGLAGMAGVGLRRR